MTPAQFKKWRKALDLSQKEAAELLGIKRRQVQYYEKGERDGKDIQIPRAIALACCCLHQGIVEFDGEMPKILPKDDLKKLAEKLEKHHK
jgi:transcriptional regulator with XRE-family HTH domain